MKAITGDTPGIDPVWVYKMAWPGSLVYKMPWPVTRILINQGSWSGHFINQNWVNSWGIPGDSLVFPCVAHVPSWCILSVFSVFMSFLAPCKMAWPGSLVYKMLWPVTRILTNQGSWSGHFINPNWVNSWGIPGDSLVFSLYSQCEEKLTGRRVRRRNTWKQSWSRNRRKHFAYPWVIILA